MKNHYMQTPEEYYDRDRLFERKEKVAESEEPIMWEKCNVVMLPTNEKAKVGDIVFNPKQNTIDINQNPKIEEINKNGQFGIWASYHLYLLSDDEIKEGDWYVDDTGEIRRSVTSDKDYWERRPDYKKVIASTDPTLAIEPYQGHFEGIDCTNYLPSIPQSFIDKYVSEYNKENKIEEVMVEYEEYDSYPPVSFMPDKLKLNSDNTINIKQMKDCWTREEVIELIELFASSIDGTDKQVHPFMWAKKWIESNL